MFEDCRGQAYPSPTPGNIARKLFYPILRDTFEDRRTLVQQSPENLRKVLNVAAEAIVALCEKRDPYTADHQRRVAQLACAIAREMGLPDEQVDGIRIIGVVHDIGKIAVPGEILSKPGKLSAEEFSIIKTHPQVAYDVLRKLEFPWPVAETVLQHHERLDGSG